MRRRPPCSTRSTWCTEDHIGTGLAGQRARRTHFTVDAHNRLARRARGDGRVSRRGPQASPKTALRLRGRGSPRRHLKHTSGRSEQVPIGRKFLGLLSALILHLIPNRIVTHVLRQLLPIEASIYHERLRNHILKAREQLLETTAEVRPANDATASTVTADSIFVRSGRHSGRHFDGLCHVSCATTPQPAPLRVYVIHLHIQHRGGACCQRR